MKKFAYSILVMALLSSSITKGQVLSVSQVIQEEDEWCWAGVSACVLDYYCTPTPQCDIAEYTRTVATWHNFGSTNCCTNPNQGCDYWNYNWGYDGSIQDILIHFAGISNYGVGSSLSTSLITSNIQSNKVFIIRWGWYTGGGHFVVGHGISGSNIYYMDPWYGEGLKVANYSWIVDDGNHEWTHTNVLSVSPVSDPPNQPGSISGNTSICQGTTNTYSITPVSGAVDYTWSLPSGWSGSSSSTSIIAIAGANGGTISVTANNSCGSSLPETLSVTVSSIPVLPSVINGNSYPEVGSSETYSVSNVAGVTYNWTFPSDWIQTGGGNSNSVTVVVGEIAGNIEVTPINLCGTGPTQVKSVLPYLPVVADFIVDISSGEAPLTVNFTNLSTGDSQYPLSYEWDLNGDVWPDSNEENPSWTYNVNGIFTVSLNATCITGEDTETKVGYIIVGDCNYCTSSGGAGTEEGISNVTFNTINNNSTITNYLIGYPSYQDFTSITTNVVAGSLYNLAVTISQWEAWTEHCWAFFDWNQDCDFEDNGESYDLGDITSGTLDMDILIPIDAIPGNTKMRVSVMFESDPGPCSTFTYGEVEDYTITIVEPPHIVVIPESHNFGDVDLYGPTATFTFEVKNDGGSVAEGYIDPEMFWEFIAPFFYVTSGAGNFSIEPDSSHYFEVSFWPVESVGYSAEGIIYGSNCNNDTVYVSGNAVNYFNITTESFPSEGGTTYPVDSTYDFGQECCIYAYPNPGYLFLGWDICPPESPPFPVTTLEHCFYVYNDQCWGAAFISFNFQFQVNLSGGFNGTDMNPYPDPGSFPLDQPYNTPPWNYAGDESVTALPNANIVDWVLVELRDPPGDVTTATESTRVGRQAAFLLNDGSIIGMDGSTQLSFDISSSNNFHVVIWHRNHVGIISADPLDRTGYVGEFYSYDFTDNAAKAYGGELAQKEIADGIWGMIGADADANNIVDNLDKESWSASVGKSGYFSSDFNLDNEVDNVDKNDVWWPNQGYSFQLPSNYINTDTNYIPLYHIEDWIFFDIFSNVSWTVTNPCTDWLTVSPMSGIYNETINLGFTQNWEITSRTCTLTFEGGGIIYEVVVEQEGFPFCNIDPYNINIGSEAGSYVVDVISNGQWSIFQECFLGDWISFSPSGGTKNGSFTVTYDENTSGIARCCSLRVDFMSLSGVGLVEYRMHEVCQDTGSITFVCDDPLIDTRDGRVYNTVQIGDQCWMAENLNFGTMINLGIDQTDNDTVNKYCIGNIESNCAIYGANYQWGEIMNYISTEGSQGICPDGWYVPTDPDWCILENFVDIGTVDCNTNNIYRGTDAGGNLKSQSALWTPDNVGATDDFRFSALPGGWYTYSTGQLIDVGLYGQFFTSSSVGGVPWTRGLQNDLQTIRRKAQNGLYGQNLRCIKY